MWRKNVRKSDIARKVVTYLLLAFVGVSIVVLIAAELKAGDAASLLP